MNQNQIGKLSIFAITWPIFIEFALQMLMRTTGTLMLSRVSDDAVASVGVANQIIMFAILTFNFIAVGSAVVISQYLGAKKSTEEINSVVGSSLGINILSGIIMSLGVIVFSGTLLSVFGLKPELFAMAQEFLYIVGGALILQALITVTVAIIQSHGQTRYTMAVTLGMNVVNIVCIYLFVFGPFGIPKLGVLGVALSTVISQLLALIAHLFVLRRIVGVRVGIGHLTKWKLEHVAKVLRIGVPSSMVNISYNASQFVTTAFVSSLGAQMLTTKIYTQNIIFIVMIIGIAMGRGLQIVVGHLIGAGQIEEAYKQTFSTLKASLVISLAGVGLICLFRVPLLDLFTDSSDIIRMGSALLLLGFLLEPGRNFNILFERALQAAGDARFPMISALLVMWLFSVPLTYYLGIHLGFGLVGIWAAFILDEWVRGAVLYVRWKSRVWEKKALVKQQEAVNS
ncbi:MATE family efflux transporter [Paenibacillus sambharensis]|uniref:MATE family efflux transporter n=1 Tax=Paenibacillus sambharensis TaxID=1803190 RepID=A0A2W1LBE8_9BACL|nr:MATE family efflux transporter [Paenibacillus sambharensis]PZD96536.1 MATE family efflux transporter [Paenibacillus sambharensis]